MTNFIGFGDGRDGPVSAASGTINTYAACTGTSGAATVTTTLSVSIGDYVFLHQSQGTGAGNREMVKVLSTGAGSFTADRNLANSYGTGAQAVKCPQYTAGTMSGSLSATSWDGTKGGIIRFIVNGPFVNTGTIAVNGGTGSNTSGSESVAGASVGGFRGGTARRRNHDTPFLGSQGESYSGVGSDATGANNNGGGAGQIVNNTTTRAGGGGGGNGAGGSNGTRTDGNANIGSGAGTGGTADLTTMVFGGGGGGGANCNGGAVETFSGSSGGGLIYITAISIDTSSGNINANGGAGGSVFSGSGVTGAGGGGGSVLLEVQTAVLGTNKITATAGGAGGGIGDSALGGAGGAGRIAIRYQNSYSGTSNPTINATQDPTLVASSGGGFLAYFM